MIGRAGGRAAVQWRDTAQRYRAVSRFLHWTMATLFAWQFAGMAIKEIVGRTPLTRFWVGSHASVGIVLLALVVGRLGWALAQRRRRPPYRAGAAGLAARGGHFALYALMLAVPLLALMRAIGQARPIAVFGATLRGPREGEIGWLTAPADWLHGNLAWLLLALVAGHASMVLVHRRRGDDIAARMIGREAPPGIRRQARRVAPPST